MAIDRQPLDTSYGRGVRDIGPQQSRLEQDVGTQRAWNQQDYQTGGLRLGQDYNTSRGRLGEDTQVGLGQMALQLTRAAEDRQTGLVRAGRENLEFGLDTAAQKAYQAAQTNCVPPARPRNEGVTARGVPYRDIRQGGFIGVSSRLVGEAAV
jgi:hypothetical protein